MTSQTPKPAPTVERLWEQLRDWFLKKPRVANLWRAAPPEIEHAERAIVGVHEPVRPSDGFRDHLRYNLELAAQQSVAGPEIEYPRQLYRGLWLGLSAGVLAAGLTALLVRLFWPRTRVEQ